MGKQNHMNLQNIPQFRWVEFQNNHVFENDWKTIPKIGWLVGWPRTQGNKSTNSAYQL